jgi:acyl dehydratase
VGAVSDAAARAIDLLRARIGEEEPPSDWYLVDQDQIDRFASATADHNFMHVDPDEARLRSPYGVTVAHGFLTLALISHFVKQVPARTPDPYAGVVARINRGLNRVRFVAPVRVNARIRGRCTLVAAERKNATSLDVAYGVTVDIEHQERPACVAEYLLRLVYR